MSGVFGYVNARSNLGYSTVKRMGERMCHQPHFVVDSKTVEVGVGLGRIGIGVFNDLTQTVSSPDGKVFLFLSGEFYHQDERRAALTRKGTLRESAENTDLALAAYLEEGAQGLTNLEGAFTIAIWDGRNSELLLVNDRFGLYPHYYAHVGGCLAFAPEIKGVLCAPEVPLHLDRTAIAQYVRFQQILGDKTWFDSVKLLPPATLLRYRPGEDKLTISHYWDWDSINTLSSISLSEAVEECTRLLQRSIDEMIKGPYRFGIYLSGGLDGRAILGFVDGQVPVTAITYGAAGCRDVIYAAELARRARCKHIWFPFLDGKWVLEHAPLHLALTEGMHSWMHAHGINTLTEARKLIDVNLNGWDGATVFGGYVVDDNRDGDTFYRRPPSEPDLIQRMYDMFCQHIAWPGLNEAEAAALFSGQGEAQMRWLAFDSLREEVARTAHYPPDRRVEYFYLQQHNRRSTQNLVVIMRSAIEQRCPFFDYDFVTFMYSLPEHIRTRQGLRRKVMTRRMPHLAMVPNERTDRLFYDNRLIYHSHSLAQRVKRKINRYFPPIFPDRPRLYADYENYLRAELREWAEGILFDRRTQDRELFDPDAVRALWERHLSGKELWTIGKIAPLMSVELVLRSLYDGDGECPASPLEQGVSV